MENGRLLLLDRRRRKKQPTRTSVEKKMRNKRLTRGRKVKSKGGKKESER